MFSAFDGTEFDVIGAAAAGYDRTISLKKLRATSRLKIETWMIQPRLGAG